MNYMLRLLIIVGALPLFSTLADARGSPQPNLELGAIGVVIREGILPFARKAVEVFFVRVDTDTDIFKANSFMRSSMADKGQVYLVNVRPGRYVAVGARFPGYTRTHTSTVDDKKETHTTYVPTYYVAFSRDMIPLTEVTVTGGKMTFMGNWVIHTELFHKWDTAQAHYIWPISGTPVRSSAQVEKKGFFRRLFGQGYPGHAVTSIRKSADYDTRTKTKFWKRASKTFKNSPWLQQGYEEN